MAAYDISRRRRGVVRPSPLFLAFAAATVLGGAIAWFENGQGSRIGDFGVLVFVLAGWIVSVCFHEFAHAYTAYRAGDHSVESAGYLTLNPFKYAHPVLSILLPLFFIVQGGIGLPGGAVYLHRHAFRSRAMQSLAAFVGPLTNLVLATVLLTVAKSHDGSVVDFLNGQPGTHARFWGALAFLGFLQVTAAVLNLLPMPGLDGYAILEPYLDPDTARMGEKVKPWGFIIVIVLLQIQTLNSLFFKLVLAIYDLFGASRTLYGLGYAFFRFWQKNPY